MSLLNNILLAQVISSPGYKAAQKALNRFIAELTNLA
jgi:hypothetical protein